MNQNRPPEPGGVSPEEAERLAEKFKPAWEVDDAPRAEPAQASEFGGAQPRAPTASSPAIAQPAPRVDSAPPPQPRPSSAPPAASEATRAARARHSKTMLGLAPPKSEAAPNAFAVAVPPARLTPSAAPKSNLPSVMLSDSLGPAAAKPFPDLSASTLIVQRPDDDPDAIPFRRRGKSGVFIGIGVVAVVGIGALLVLGRDQPSGAVPSSATSVATPPATPAVTAAPTPPPAAADPTPAPSAPEAPAPSPATPAVAAPTHAAPSATGATKASPPSEAVAPPKEVPKATPGEAEGRREAAPLPKPIAPKPTPAPQPKPAAPRPAPVSKPAGGIVRDVPF